MLPGLESEQRKVSLSQWPTPPETAARIVTFAKRAIEHGKFVRGDGRLHVLEPSCGMGNLADAVLDQFADAFVTGIDIDSTNIEICSHRFDTLEAQFVCADFLEYPEGERFHVAILNPPFEGGQTERHILHALKFARRVVCHCPLTTLAGQGRRAGLWSQVDLEALAICSTRPRYGECGGKTDMCTVMVSTLREPRNPGSALTVELEWWP